MTSQGVAVTNSCPFSPGDLVSINGPLGEPGVTHGEIRELVKRPWGWCAVMRTSDSEYLQTIPIHHLAPVTNAEYQAWLAGQYARRHRPPLQGPLERPRARLDPELERAIQILAIAEHLRQRWRANGILEPAPVDGDQLGLFAEGEAA